MSKCRPERLVILLHGCEATGRNSLGIRLYSNHYSPDFEPTLGEIFALQTMVDGEVFNVDLVTIPGGSLHESAFKHCVRLDAVILAYGIDDRNSFEELPELRQQILTARNATSLPCVLCGTKCDRHKYREVTEAEARELAAKFNASFIETSAQDNINCTELLIEAVQEYLKVNPLPPPGRSPENKRKRRPGCSVA